MINENNSGICVPYSIRDSADKGRGIFVEQEICKGTILWRHQRGQYAVYDERSFKALIINMSRSEVVYELEHVFGLPEFPGYIIRIFDDGVLINHSDNPTVEINNCVDGKPIPYQSSAQNIAAVEDALMDERFALIATQDLRTGDEMTHDYNIGIEEPAYYDILCEEYEITWDWL